mgnify:CR=1 FL=1
MDRLGDEQQDATKREIETVENRSPRKVYDFSEWLDSTNAALRADDMAELSLNGPWAERNGGQAAIEAWRRQISNLVRTQSRQRMVTYKDFLEGKKTLCDSETLIYKLVKYATSPTNPRERRVLQNYFFANTDEISMINFVDTQVKYGKYYQYELYAYDIVYGSKFLFRTRFASFPEHRDTLVASRNGQGGTLGFYSFNVDTQPNVKIVEYPINVYEWRRKIGPRRTQLGSYAVPALNSRPDLTVGGISYPISRVQDYPPLTPEANILSFKDTDNRVLINLSPGVGEYLEEDALKYIALNAEEEQELREISDAQRLSGLRQSSTEISYREQQGPIKMLIYRTETIDANVAKGAYTLIDTKGSPEIIILATGSEVSLAIEVAKKLDGKKVRVVSMPCWETFDKQTDEYKKEVIPDRGSLKISIEAGITNGWEKYIGINGLAIGINHFGSSAPAGDLAHEFGFTADQIADKIEKFLGKLL